MGGTGELRPGKLLVHWGSWIIYDRKAKPQRAEADLVSTLLSCIVYLTDSYSCITRGHIVLLKMCNDFLWELGCDVMRAEQNCPPSVGLCNYTHVHLLLACVIHLTCPACGGTWALCCHERICMPSNNCGMLVGVESWSFEPLATHDGTNMFLLMVGGYTHCWWRSHLMLPSGLLKWATLLQEF